MWCELSVGPSLSCKMVVQFKILMVVVVLCDNRCFFTQYLIKVLSSFNKEEVEEFNNDF